MSVPASPSLSLLALLCSLLTRGEGEVDEGRGRRQLAGGDFRVKIPKTINFMVFPMICDGSEGNCMQFDGAEQI